MTEYCLTMLLKPRGRSSEAVSEYTLSIEHEYVRLGVPPIGGVLLLEFSWDLRCISGGLSTLTELGEFYWA